MPIVYDELLRFAIPPVAHPYVKRDCAFYALSVGVGQDPLDRRQLAFVDPNLEMDVLPSMAAVLAHPGFWISDPATGIDARQSIHVEQSLRLHNALPSVGMVVGTTRVVEVVDKGPGRGALLVSEKQLCDRSGRVLATTRNTTLMRANGGFGGPQKASTPWHEAPARPADSIVDLATRPEQALLYRLNGDFNPLHADPDAAQVAGFPRPIMHGLCTFAMVSHAVLRTLCDYDTQRFRQIDLRFSAPAYPGDNISVELWREGNFRARIPARDGIVIAHGKAAVA